MNPTRHDNNRTDAIGKPVLGAPASRRRVNDQLAGETPALPGMLLRFRGVCQGLQKAALLAGLLVLGLANGFFAAAQTTNTPAGNDYSSFRIIAERNIFDPNRYPHATRTAHRTVNNRVPAFSLVGTMTYKQGMLAFFDGTDSDSRKVLAVNGTINGYTVAEITLRGVRLESAGKPVILKVGAQMRLEGKEWQLAESGGQPVQMTAAETPASGAPPVAADPSLEGNDVLKKLMQKREQELK